MANKQSHLIARFSLDDSMFSRGIKNLGRGVSVAKSAMAGVAKVALSVAAAVGITAAVLSSPIAKAAAFEDAVVGFEQLLGGAEAARARIAELSSFAASTPFELPEVIKASRVLETLTKGALSTGAGLRMVGDAAAATEQPIEELATWFGRLYDGLQSGRPVGEALMRLQELGLVSGDTRAKLESLQKQGIKGAAAWSVVTASMERFSGLMDKRSRTWSGKVSNLGDAWGQLMTKFGTPIKEALTPYLDAVIAVVSSLVSNGESFGKGLVDTGGKFLVMMTGVMGAFSSLPAYFKFSGALLKLVFMEALVLLKDGFVGLMKFWAGFGKVVWNSGFLQGMVEVVKQLGLLLGNSFVAAIPRLWDGLKMTAAAFGAGLTTAAQTLVEVLLTGLVRVIDYFGQGWRKAIWDPLAQLGERLSNMAVKFGETIKNFLSANWSAAKESAQQLVSSGLSKAEDFKSAASGITASDIDKFMRSFRASSFEDNYKAAKGTLDASDPLKPFMDSLQTHGDKGIAIALGKLKDIGAAVADPFKKMFKGGSLEASRDRLYKEFQEVIKGLSPIGKAAMVNAIAAAVPAAPGLANKGKISAPFFPAGSKMSLGSTLLDVRPSGGLVTGGLRSGNLLNPQQVKTQEPAKDPTAEATLDIRKILSDLLSLNKNVWTKA